MLTRSIVSKEVVQGRDQTLELGISFAAICHWLTLASASLSERSIAHLHKNYLLLLFALFLHSFQLCGMRRSRRSSKKWYSIDHAFMDFADGHRASRAYWIVILTDKLWRTGHFLFCPKSAHTHLGNWRYLHRAPWRRKDWTASDLKNQYHLGHTNLLLLLK